MAMEKEWFRIEVGKMARNYNGPITDEEIDIFWEHLSNISQEGMDRCIDSIIEREDFFPTIAVFNRHLGLIAEPGEKGEDFGRREIIVKTKIGKDSLKLVLDLMDGKILKDEYIKRLLRLHEEYPGAGFNLAVHGLKNAARFFNQVQLKENGEPFVVDKVIKKYPQTGVVYSFGGSVAKEREKKIQEPEEKVMDEKSVDKNSYRAIEDDF